jgi:rare lipoprotein A
MWSQNIVRIVVAVSLGLTACTRNGAGPASGEEVGIASWYGHPYHGRPTASGEVYDMEKMTAAHRSLPLGTVVRVESLVNGQTVEVRINDRGPFVQGRIIDLSHAAAQGISMQGIANVRLQVISMPRTRAADVFAVQLGAFQQRVRAEQLQKQLENKYGSTRLVFREGDQSWRVLVGLEPTVEAANALAQQLQKEAEPTFVVLVDSEE